MGYRAKLASFRPLVNPALLAQTNYKQTKTDKPTVKYALNVHNTRLFNPRIQYRWTCRTTVNALRCTTFWKPCVIIMLPCEVSKQASTTASLASWLNSPGTGQRRSAQIATANPNLSSLPSYKSRRSFGLSSVFPSVSRHVGPNPDGEIIRADAAAEFRESLVPLSGSSVKPPKIA